MFDRDATHRRNVPINDAPGIDGRDVYFPRRASEPRFLTMTGPGVSGAQADLYLGRFNAGFDAVEKWVRVTHDDQRDFFGDAWIAPDVPAARAEAAAVGGPADGGEPESWPGSRESLVFLWEDGSKMNSVVDPTGVNEISCRTVAHGLARPGFAYAMDLAGGSYVAEGADETCSAPLDRDKCIMERPVRRRAHHHEKASSVHP